MVDSEIGSPDKISDSQNENWSKQFMCRHYKTHKKPNPVALVRLEKGNYYEYSDKTGNMLQELVLETHMGT